MESGEVKGYAGSDEIREARTDTEWKKIIDHPDFEIYWPSRTTVLGFLLAWVIVAVIIGGTMFLARVGA